MWESLFQGFSELPKSEQFKLYNAIKFLLFPADQGDVAKIIKDILAAEKGLKHEIVNIRKGIYVKKSIYHIQHVNAYHAQLKKFMQRFQGVATKYLDNYLFWFKYINQTKQKLLPNLNG